jgi:SAM-dependent methyltransferase
MSNMSQDTDEARSRFFTSELDDIAYKEAAKRFRLDNDVSALLFGRDIDELAVRMAKVGVKVVVDAAVENPPLLPGLRAMPLSQIAVDALPEAPFDLIVGQLALHSLPYDQARDVLLQLRRLLKIGGKLFLSAYGVRSTLGDFYPDSGKRVQDRFAELPAALAEPYNLHGPICLYSERDLITLLFETGVPIIHSATSGQGNVRAIAVRI